MTARKKPVKKETSQERVVIVTSESRAGMWVDDEAALRVVYVGE